MTQEQIDKKLDDIFCRMMLDVMSGLFQLKRDINKRIEELKHA